MPLLPLLLLALTSAAAANAATLNSTGGECTTYPCMIFEDNFDFLDFNKWDHEITSSGGGNGEFQYYHNSRRNSFTRDGKLFIMPTLTEEELGQDFIHKGNLDLWGGYPTDFCTSNLWGGCTKQGGNGKIVPPIQSAKLRTVKSFNFRYGRVEVDAKLPAGDWLWPAIWMLPQHNEYGGWPRSGEIDIMEARGNRYLRAPNGVSHGADQMGMTLHWGPIFPYNGWPKSHKVVNLKKGQSFADEFHRYQLEWGPDIGLVFSLNDEHVMTINPPKGFWDLGRDLFVDHQTGKPLDESIFNPWKPEQGATRLAPFDKAFNLILNVAVGGNNHYFGDALINVPYPKPWRNDARDPVIDFYKAKHLWYPTWQKEGDGRAMQVNYVKVWKMKPDQ